MDQAVFLIGPSTSALRDLNTKTVRRGKFSPEPHLFLAIVHYHHYPDAAMPLTSAAIKSMRQSATKRDNRRPFKTRMKTVLRELTDLTKAGKKDEAAKLLPVVYKVVDTAAKKHIVHWKNAARKKSLASSLVAALGKTAK